MSREVIVLGRSRSGTSLVTGFLSILGVDIPTDSKVNHWNPNGAFEHGAFVDITANLNRAIQEDDLDLIQEMKTRIPDAIATLGSTDRIWGFKSAITHNVLDYFIDYLSNPYLVFVFRNPLGTAESDVYFTYHPELGEVMTPDLRIDKLAISFRETGIFLNKIFHVIRKYRKLPMIFTTFEDLRAKPIQEARRLGKFLDLDVTPEIREQIREFVLPKYVSWKGMEKMGGH